MPATLTPSKNGQPVVETPKTDYSDRIPQEQDQHELVRLGAPLEDKEFVRTYFALQDIWKRHHVHGMMPVACLPILVFLYEAGFRIPGGEDESADEAARAEAKKQAARDRMAKARAAKKAKE